MIKLSPFPFLIRRGFTLIEITVVLFIVSLLLAGLLTPLATVIEQRDRQKTMDMMAYAKESLLGHALVHGRLPCPDQDEDGIEDRKENKTENELEGKEPAQQCTKNTGKLPWASLGAARYDAWGNSFTYRVTAAFADDVPCAGAVKDPAISFCLDTKGSIRLTDIAGNKLTTDNVLAVIVSHSRHDYDSEQEKKNRGETVESYQDTDFIADEYRQKEGEEFDDIVVWVTPTVLMYQMVQAGKLP